MKKELAIIGGGTAGLFLAAFIDTEIFDVTIYEKMNTLGRKFLVAGDGGFNLTHGEEMPSFMSRYTPPAFLKEALRAFSNRDFRAWLLDLGIPTFVGTSGRVFPDKGLKPIEVLNRIKTQLIEKDVKMEFNKTFIGWDEKGSVKFVSGETIHPKYTIFALGGASWKVTGSDGTWLDVLAAKGVKTLDFSPSNCAYEINWTEEFIQKHEGTPLKNITISLQGKTQKGETVITKFGIEGNAIYGLSPEIKLDLDARGESEVLIDFKPTLDLATLVNKIEKATSNTTRTLKEKIKLPGAAIELIKQTLNKEEYLDSTHLANRIKKFPLNLIGAAPIDEAISTIGGINLQSVDKHFELKNLKKHYCIGEMLDWNAPTGGYLIQACVSSGVYLAQHLNKLEK